MIFYLVVFFQFRPPCLWIPLRHDGYPKGAASRQRGAGWRRRWWKRLTQNSEVGIPLSFFTVASLSIHSIKSQRKGAQSGGIAHKHDRNVDESYDSTNNQGWKEQQRRGRGDKGKCKNVLCWYCAFCVNVGVKKKMLACFCWVMHDKLCWQTPPTWRYGSRVRIKQ